VGDGGTINRRRATNDVSQNYAGRACGVVAAATGSGATLVTAQAPPIARDPSEVQGAIANYSVSAIMGSEA